MNNKEIGHQFSLLSKLMEIHGENNFKATTYSVAAYKIGQLTVDLQTLSEKNISNIPGIGEATGKKIIEIISTGKLKMLEDLISKTPDGILEMLKIKGIGPKKISLIWKEMGIENIGELLYACNENRLSLYKGFGQKTQQNVIESIEFYLKQQGSFLFAQVESLAYSLQEFLQKTFPSVEINITGDFRRQAETIDMLDFVVPLAGEKILDLIQGFEEFQFLEKQDEFILYKYNNGINVKLYFTDKENLLKKTFITTGSQNFITAFENQFPNVDFNYCSNEKDIFELAGVQFIPPFLRESQ